jgi:hypothetical protein
MDGIYRNTIYLVMLFYSYARTTLSCVLACVQKHAAKPPWAIIPGRAYLWSPYVLQPQCSCTRMVGVFVAANLKFFPGAGAEAEPTSFHSLWGEIVPLTRTYT